MSILTSTAVHNNSPYIHPLPSLSNDQCEYISAIRNQSIGCVQDISMSLTRTNANTMRTATSDMNPLSASIARPTRSVGDKQTTVVPFKALYVAYSSGVQPSDMVTTGTSETSNMTCYILKMTKGGDMHKSWVVAVAGSKLRIFRTSQVLY